MQCENISVKSIFLFDLIVYGNNVNYLPLERKKSSIIFVEIFERYSRFFAFLYFNKVSFSKFVYQWQKKKKMYHLSHYPTVLTLSRPRIFRFCWTKNNLEIRRYRSNQCLTKLLTPLINLVLNYFVNNLHGMPKDKNLLSMIKTNVSVLPQCFIVRCNLISKMYLHDSDNIITHTYLMQHLESYPNRFNLVCLPYLSHSSN